MYSYGIKQLIVSGLVFYFTLNNIQAATISYPGIDTQGNPITSQITVTAQIENLFFLQIEGVCQISIPKPKNPI